MKTFTIKTLGCKANQYDSQLMRERLSGAGLKENSNGTPSDIYIINTCTVTSNADKRARNLIYKASRENPSSNIVVIGCYSDRAREKLKSIPGVGLVLGNEDKDHILSLLGAPGPGSGTITDFAGRNRAFVKVQDGCDNFCSYCIVPYVRGNPRSRAADEVKSEVRELASKGFKEIVLSGICLGAYGKDLTSPIDITDLINIIEDTNGLHRIRLSSIEPGYVTDKLIDKISNSKKLCRHLHLPLQSGDDDVLNRMKRGYTRRDFFDIIDRIKEKVSRISVTTDVLVGFPGESEEAFDCTLDAVRKIGPSRTHIFPYSRRPGTESARFTDKVDKSKVDDRVKRLKELSDRCALEYKNGFVGRDEEILVESKERGSSGVFYGYTDTYLKVAFSGRSELLNEIISVNIRSVKTECMQAAYSGH